MKVTSDFESGNMERCAQRKVVSGQGSTEYGFDVWIASDAHPYLPNVDAGRVGFFFAVTGIAGQDAGNSRTLQFFLKNSCEKTKLISSGHQPVYLVASAQEFKDLTNGALPFYRQKWRRIQNQPKYINGNDGPETVFSLNVDQGVKQSDYIFVAYSYPYTLNDVMYSIKEAEQKCRGNELIHFES